MHNGVDMNPAIITAKTIAEQPVTLISDTSSFMD